MNGSNIIPGWVALTGSIAMIALILTALGLMFGIVKPVDALRRVAGILAFIMLLLVLPSVIVNIWSSISLWQRLGLAAVLMGIWLLKRPRRESRKR
jgi:hypothetical protein